MDRIMFITLQRIRLIFLDDGGRGRFFSIGALAATGKSVNFCKKKGSPCVKHGTNIR